MEKVLKPAVAAGGGAVSYLFGGWGAALDILLFCVIVDYITGMISAFLEGILVSKAGYIGIARKITIFILVVISHKIDIYLGQSPFLRDAVVIFYIFNEMVSILENCGRIGVPIPPFLKEAIAVLKGKSEKEKGDKH
ncbi:phage holin family protein [Paenibacillus larvae]|uniref:Phage holin family protein n=2 Tax=Paenibacillus larvae TaxID=1464 RepID=A0AAP5JUP3_9BACL|nr:phage holin family protein [Paenibacillus larvae]MDT2171299.1 phage holin family protein [Paenibacillus larvae]MDT2180493.1 phage holin family protein [Paenibacillus larvae]MDT2193151.1 phage holin family protein [Paenibacillus larvae]MDT2196803.1 phage holin family protein [Paenibacillus larvae]MDT2206346.1 phage holin family protein [Paenibacillus larvae]